MNPLRIYDYLRKSRSDLFGRVRPLTDEQYRTEHPIGLGSLARTLHHVRAAEAAYVQRINGRTGPLEERPPADDPEITTEAALGFLELERLWIEQADRVRSDVERVFAGEWAVDRVCATEWDGKPYRYRASPADFFTQLVTHEVHHRAQVLHMCRRLGVETGEVDFSALMFLPADMASG